MSTYITAITGASGSIYAKRFIKLLNEAEHRQIILISEPAQDVIEYELGFSVNPLHIDASFHIEATSEREISADEEMTPDDKVYLKEEKSSSEKNMEEILAAELGLPYPELIQCEEVSKYHSTVASGSSTVEGMIVIPCTMGSIGRFSQGVSSNLIERSFDVMLKERKKIIIVPRETPLNQIHLKNMLALSEIGVDIIPAMPAFYHHPDDIMDLVDFIIGRVFEHLDLEHTLYKRWKGLE